ncbi:MAG: fucose isomerase, partial [Thermoproteota archaeon]
AKLYVAMKKVAFDYRVDAIALDCIVLHNTNLLDAWPCLGYMELWNDNIIPICEADAYSGAVLLIMKYLANRPGFISDPSLDDLTNEVIYYHCYAPLIPYGSKGCRCPYVITPAHLGAKNASVHVELPVNETITAIGFSPEERTLVVHTAQAVRNEFSPYACAVKLIGRTETRTLAKTWKYRAGWHRVVFYGDWRKELKELSALLNLKFVEEDKEV